MIVTFSWYLLRVFLAWAVFAVVAVSAVVLLFDVLANADRVVEGGSGILEPLMYYALLRLPQIASLIVPVAALLAAMVTLAQLVIHREMEAIRAAGMSIYRVVAILVSGATVLAIAHFWLANEVLPEMSSRLRIWEEGKFRGLPPAETPHRAPTWFAAGNALVQVGSSSLDGRRLSDVVVVRREKDGRMADYLRAREARYLDNVWVLENVHRISPEEPAGVDIKRLRLALPVTPRRFSALSRDPGELSFADLLELRRLDERSELPARPDYFYSLWLQRQLAHPLGSLVMVLLAAPLGMQLGRRHGPMVFAGFAALGSAFLYFVAERLLLSMGESGTLPAAIAAWSPGLLFSLGAGWVLLHLEG